MRYNPAGKKCKLDSIWAGPYRVSLNAHCPTYRTVGIQRHPDEPVVLIHCQDVKKIPPPGGMQSWLTIPPTGGTPAVPMLGTSTVAHTSRDSPSVTALPPDEGVEMADVDSEQNEQSMIQYRGSIQTSTHLEGGRSSLKTGSADPPVILFASPVVRRY